MKSDYRVHFDGGRRGAPSKMQEVVFGCWMMARSLSVLENLTVSTISTLRGRRPNFSRIKYPSALKINKCTSAGMVVPG